MADIGLRNFMGGMLSALTGYQRGQIQARQENEAAQQHAYQSLLNAYPGLMAQEQQQDARDLQPYLDAASAPGLTDASRQGAEAAVRAARAAIAANRAPAEQALTAP